QPRPAVPPPPATSSRGPARNLPVVAQDRTDPSGAATGTRSTTATAQPGRGTTRTALAYLRSCGGKSCLGVSRWRPPHEQNEPGQILIALDPVPDHLIRLAPRHCRSCRAPAIASVPSVRLWRGALV